MSKIIIVGTNEIKSLQEGEKNVTDYRKHLTYEELHALLKAIPEPIEKSREDFEKLATAMTSLSFGKQKVVINEIHSVNPNARHFKNKRKW
ncbi:hypothetical protein DBR39_13670 [Chryseobacterium sp. KBW03]|uniref:hypothetical protein n=1 Tax=Chryseobacterium sp. KBW03 TaxID=2153362 RepID=UPI000F5A7EEF|nr:hypothetical protein [Chryseobacterium sp. KBW03]RQO37932.1 hypothetical protein DBR39_13670 [Chryseobacterium sp. KBW03]